MLRFREFLLLEYNEDKNWANHGAKITERLKSQGINSGHREFWDKQIKDHDPTPNKEYAGWISQKYASGGIRHHEDIGSRVGPALETYHKHKLKKTLETHGVSKDIGAIKNITHLEDSVNKLPRVKEKTKNVSDSEVTKHDEEHWKVYTPHTEAAAKKYGAGTKWCTAAKKNNMFKDYKDCGHLHIYVPKNPNYPGEKYQAHRKSISFVNERNYPVNDKWVFKDRPSPHNKKYGVATKNITKALDDSNLVTRIAAIEHHKVTPEHISKALNDSSWNIRAIAIRHSKVTPEHISKALDDSSWNIRAIALEHPKVTPEHISKALNDKDADVRVAALEHPKVTPEHISKALNDKDEDVVHTAKNIAKKRGIKI